MPRFGEEGGEPLRARRLCGTGGVSHAISISWIMMIIHDEWQILLPDNGFDSRLDDS